MLRLLGFVLVVLSIFGLSYQFINAQLPSWKNTTLTLLEEAEQAGLDPLAWQRVASDARTDLPPVYPFSRVQNVLQEASDLVSLVNQFQDDFSINFSLESQTIDPNDLRQFFALLGQTDQSLKKIIKNLDSLPDWALDADTRTQYQARMNWLRYLQTQVQDAQTFESVFNGFLKKEERVLLLLQNQNEPRSTGGFAGSLVRFNFSEDKITWQFLDVYALDRLVPGEAQLEAPDYFKDLSPTISLRDANFWPDFPTSAQTYQQLLKAAGQEPPSTVVAINLNTIREILRFTPPVKIDRWDVALDQYNFDIVLQFLLGSQITGRYNVKAPVEMFAKELFKKENLAAIDWDDWALFNGKEFLATKNVLAYSSNKELQQLFIKWGLDGTFYVKPEVDNFLHFDFVSVGANKSEKFVWTKLDHDSDIQADGTVINTLKVRRTHALRPNEIQDLLGFNQLSENVKSLLDEDLQWILGAGENRTVLRVWVPPEAVLLGAKDPSGAVRWRKDPVTNRNYYEVPLNVLPGETLEAEIRYQTKLIRGSVGWRPYYLQLLGTPGRDKTSLITTISTQEGGRFTAATQNLGRPAKLVDQDFRAVIEFEVPETDIR